MSSDEGVHGVTGGRSPALARTGGCDVVWQHTRTGASLGICGGRPQHTVTTTCRRCQVTGTRQVCGYCWGSYSTSGLCGTCLEPLEITEKTP